MTENIKHKELSDQVINLAKQVHKELGEGFLERVYQEALAIVLTENGIPFEREKRINITFHGKVLDCPYIADFLIDGKIILELKAVPDMEMSHVAQILHYLKATGIEVGYLINFGTPYLTYKRFFNFY